MSPEKTRLQPGSADGKPGYGLVPCEPRAFVTRTCERGFKGCDILHDRSYRIEDLLDKLAAAGVEITINGQTAKGAAP